MESKVTINGPVRYECTYYERKGRTFRLRRRTATIKDARTICEADRRAREWASNLAAASGKDFSLTRLPGYTITNPEYLNVIGNNPTG